MPNIRIIKKCVFTDASGERKVFDPGVHEVDDYTANHWFVQAHRGEVIDTKADADAQAAAEKLSAAMAELEQLRAEKAEREAADAESKTKAEAEAQAKADEEAKAKAASDAEAKKSGKGNK